VKEADGSLKVSGDLGKIFGRALADSDAGYKNDAAAFSTQYGLDAQVALNGWWNS